MACLGVTDFVRLGGDHRFRDSGMAWADDGTATARDILREGIFWTTDLLAAANELVPLIRDRRPQVLVTYNEIGGYGHPDHIQAHRVAMYGVPARRDAALPARPRLGVAGRPGAVDDHERDQAARGSAGAAGGRRHRDLRRAGPRGSVVRSDGRARRGHRRRHRRRTVGGAEAGRHAGARHPDHRRTGSSSAARRSWATRCGRTSTTGSRPASPIPTRPAGPTTSSPA